MPLTNRQYFAVQEAFRRLPLFKAFAEGYVAMSSHLTVSRTNPNAPGLRPPRGVVIEKIAVRGNFPATLAGRRAQNRAFSAFLRQFASPRGAAGRDSSALSAAKCAAFDIGKRQARGDFPQHSFVRNGQFVTGGTIEAQVLSVPCPYRRLATNLSGMARGMGDATTPDDPTAQVEGDLNLSPTDDSADEPVDTSGGNTGNGNTNTGGGNSGSGTAPSSSMGMIVGAIAVVGVGALLFSK